MRKTLKLSLGISLVSLLLWSGTASATASPTSNYAEIFMTDTNGGTTAKTTPFAWDQKPWLRLKFTQTDNGTNGSDFSNTVTLWTWDNPNPLQTDPTNLITSDLKNNNIWVSFTDAYWSSIKNSGNWTVVANSTLLNYTPFNYQTYNGATTFQVNAVPEPVSTILFLTGGAAMAGRLVRRKLA